MDKVLLKAAENVGELVINLSRKVLSLLTCHVMCCTLSLEGVNNGELRGPIRH